MEATSAPVTLVFTATVKFVKLVSATIDGVVPIKNAFRLPPTSVNAMKALVIIKRPSFAKTLMSARSEITVTGIQFVQTQKAASVVRAILDILVTARLVK